MIHMIVAMTKDRVIGKRNALPWHISDDLRRFKKLTSGHTIIMGRRTYDSIGRPLPNRHNVVLDTAGSKIVGADVCQSIPEALAKAKSYGNEIFIIGGARVYEQMLSLVDVLHVSHIKRDYEGDVYFPHYDTSEWRAVGSPEEHSEFTAITYERIREQQPASA